MDKPFGKSAISVEEARRLINSSIRLVDIEAVELREAHGRVVAVPLTALTRSPPFEVSAMDGYAVRMADVPEAGVTLPLSGESKAGVPAVPTLEPGTCMRIFTGAPLPSGADAIVIQEDVQAAGSRIVFNAAAVEGLNIRRAGLNFDKGDEIVKAGRALTARDVGLLAAAGYASVAVRRRQRIAVLSTGDEVAADKAGAGSGQILDANRPALTALIKACGGDPIDLGIAGDDDAAITSALEGLDAALLVVTGGASVGDHDRVRPALQALGLSFNFWKIASSVGATSLPGSAWFRVNSLPGAKSGSGAFLRQGKLICVDC